jgi:hypothetical protein
MNVEILMYEDLYVTDGWEDRVEARTWIRRLSNQHG